MRNIKNGKLKIFKIGDLLLLIVLLASIIAAVVLTINKEPSLVEIYVDGKLVQCQDINLDTEISLLDGNMLIKIENKRVWVASSACAEQLCVHQSPISSGGGMIVCLPQKVVIKLATKEVDAIT